MNLLCVPPNQVPHFWPHVGHYIAAALSNVGLSEIEAIRDRLFKGEALLWIAAEDTQIQGAGATQLVMSCGRKVCEIVAWSSDKHEAGLFDVIEQHAIAEGCAAVRLIGRKGWLRKLRDFNLRAVILEKVI